MSGPSTKDEASGAVILNSVKDLCLSRYCPGGCLATRVSLDGSGILVGLTGRVELVATFSPLALWLITLGAALWKDGRDPSLRSG